MIDVEIEAEGWRAALPGVEALVRRAAAAALPAGSAAVILLTDDAALQALNARFRGRDAPTNVLSFPAPIQTAPAPMAQHRGDLALALETCRREAEAQGKALADHLTHLVVHGALHLIGRDHEDDAEAEAMEAEERTILAGLGVADPYLCRDDT